MREAIKYDLGFSGCSLKSAEMVHFLKISRGILPEDVGGKFSSVRRKSQEFRKRLKTLTPPQTVALIEGDSILQRQLAYLSVCKVYDFIREFVLEVLREKMILMDYQVTEGEYLSFFRRKMMDHPELEELSETTEKKIKQVVFRMLAEAGIINSAKEKVLQYQILEPELIQLIKNDHPKWFEVFLLNDLEISTYSN
jgi:hypothetical protein